MTTVSVLVSGLDAELVRLGYAPSTMKWYRGSWRRMERWFESRGEREFSLDVAMCWVDEACGGFFAKEQAGTLKQTDVYLFRVAQMLEDFTVHGAVLRRYTRSVSKLTAGQADLTESFQVSLRAAGCAVSTVRAYGTIAGEFLAFTGLSGGLAGLDVGVIGSFVATLAGYQAKTVEHKLCGLRSLLRFAAGEGLIEESVLLAVPAARSTKQARIPSVWDPGVAVDVTDQQSVETAVAQVVARYDRVDILVNCAGMVLRSEGKKLGIRDIALEAWQRSLDVNLTSVFLCARAVIPIMERHFWGRIVTISSQGGRTGGAFSSVDYGAAKAGVIGLSRTLAVEVGPLGITVNCVAPGRVKSPMTGHEAEQTQSETFLARLPIPRMAEASEIAATVSHLCSTEAGYITGATIDINGGGFMA